VERGSTLGRRRELGSDGGEFARCDVGYVRVPATRAGCEGGMCALDEKFSRLPVLKEADGAVGLFFFFSFSLAYSVQI